MKNRKLIRIGITLLLLLPLLFLYYVFSFNQIVFLLMFSVVYLIIGFDVLFSAVKNILHGNFFDENFLMSLATVGALAIGKYPEAIAVMLFFQIGELFQDSALDKSKEYISELMSIKPEKAVILKDDKEFVISPESVQIGDILYVKAGEKISVDGVVVDGEASVDASALTGESMPKYLKVDDLALSGCINLDGAIKIRAEKIYRDSTVSQILDLVENAAEKKANTENFITKFAKYYTPIVVLLALLLAFVPPIIDGQWYKWIYRSLSFLVVSCPCALVISIPLSFFMGIGGASKYGVLIKGGNYLELLDKANIFIFDKTGTLTKGEFVVHEVLPENKRQEVLMLAASAESGSLHPIAKSIINYYEGELLTGYNIKEISGKGIQAYKDGDLIICGNDKIMDDNNIKYISHDGIGAKIYVARNNEFVGSILIVDGIKKEAKTTIENFKNQNIDTIMISGDNETVVTSVAKELNIDQYYYGLLPDEKVKKIEALLASKNKGDVIAFVGDGINDAPALMRADVGISMGGIGSASAIEASDIVIMHDNLSDILRAQQISKKTIRIVKENIIFSLGVKFAVLALSAFGLLNMWWAVFADVGVTTLAILNAMRAIKK